MHGLDYGVIKHVTCEKDQQEQDPNSPEPPPLEGGELFGLQEMRSGQAAARGVWQLWLRESQDYAETRQGIMTRIAKRCE